MDAVDLAEHLAFCLNDKRVEEITGITDASANDLAEVELTDENGKRFRLFVDEIEDEE
jgi:hypothetical protein